MALWNEEIVAIFQEGNLVAFRFASGSSTENALGARARSSQELVLLVCKAGTHVSLRSSGSGARTAC